MIFQESVCLDNGSYLMNYAGCHECGSRESIKVVNRQETNDEADEEHEELITFQRKYYTVKFLNFRVPENYVVIYLKFKQRGWSISHHI